MRASEGRQDGYGVRSKWELRIKERIRPLPKSLGERCRLVPLYLTRRRGLKRGKRAAGGYNERERKDEEAPEVADVLDMG